MKSRAFLGVKNIYEHMSLFTAPLFFSFMSCLFYIPIVFCGMGDSAVGIYRV